MATLSLTQIVHDPNTRLGRAVLLFEEHGDEIEALGTVPGSEHGRVC